MTLVAEATARIEAPVERVWEAWTDPVELARWYPDRVAGSLAGDRATLVWDCYGMELELQVLEREGPRRLVLGGDPSGRRPQRQIVELTPEGAATTIRIRHDGFGDGPRARDERDGTAAGWNTMLAVLRLYLERYPGRDRRTFAVLGPVRAPFEELFARFTTAAGLASWLGASDGLGEAGTAATVHSDRLVIAGQIISRSPPREIALHCDELDALVVLRGFALGGGTSDDKLAGAWVSCWSPGPALDDLREVLAAGVDRLAAQLCGHVHDA